MSIIERETVKADLWKLEQRIGEAQCAWARPSKGSMQKYPSRESCRSVPVTAGSMVELGTDIDEAIGFEPESVWPVIAILWDMHGYKGVYDVGVVGVWMEGLGAMLYVYGVHSYE